MLLEMTWIAIIYAFTTFMNMLQLINRNTLVEPCSFKMLQLCFSIIQEVKSRNIEIKPCISFMISVHSR